MPWGFIPSVSYIIVPLYILSSLPRTPFSSIFDQLTSTAGIRSFTLGSFVSEDLICICCHSIYHTLLHNLILTLFHPDFSGGQCCVIFILGSMLLNTAPGSK